MLIKDESEWIYVKVTAIVDEVTWDKCQELFSEFTLSRKNDKTFVCKSCSMHLQKEYES